MDARAAELIQETAGRGRFQAVTPVELLHAAEYFCMYRSTSLDIIRHTDRDTRRMFFSDLRELGRRSFPEIQLIMQLMAHFSPHILKSGANSDDPMFVDIVLP